MILSSGRAWRRREEGRGALVGELIRVKENTGRTFLRKALFLQRSLGLVAQLSELVSRAGVIEIGEGKDGEVEVELDGDMEEVLATLREDLKTQRQLDEGLRKGVLGACGERRWGGSENERIMVRRFVLFVEGRLGVLEGCYERVGGVVEGIGSVVGC